jgi:3-methyl-2-oxobutanoate hydroxymethyltransferase
VPRHSKKYADLASEYARLQQIRIDAFKAFVADVQTGAYPAPEYLVKAPEAEMAAFSAKMKAE